MKPVIVLLAAALTLSAQYKVEPAGAPPADTAALSAVLVKDGLKIVKPDGSVLMELWPVAKAPAGGAPQEGVSLGTFPHGALLGAVNFPARYSDRRGFTIKPGVYTLRYSLYPVNGDHIGVAPQRDFAVLSPVALDKDPAALPAFDPLMDMARKASGAPHPLSFSLWKGEAGAKGVTPEGENDQVLHYMIGDMPVSMIIVGKTDH